MSRSADGVSDQCYTLKCFDDREEGDCYAYQPRSLVGCHCLDRLKTLMAEEGMVSGATKFFDEEDEVCGSWTSALLAAQVLTVFAAITVASVNTILKETLHCAYHHGARPAVRTRGHFLTLV